MICGGDVTAMANTDGTGVPAMEFLMGWEG
jgi:hypothetical protein